MAGADADIAEARALLDRAERESDPEQRTNHIEEALLLLETVDDPSPAQAQLIANLRTSCARRLLTLLPALKTANFEVWLFYFNVLENLADEVEALVTGDPTLAENHRQFATMWKSGHQR
jgi:hypothetical protein